MKSILEAKTIKEIQEWCDVGNCGESCVFSIHSNSDFSAYCSDVVSNIESEQKIPLLLSKVLSINRKEKLEKLLKSSP